MNPQAISTSRFLVGGEWRASSRTKPVVNPYDNKTVGEVYQASPKDIEEAIASAASTFHITRQLPSYERAAALSFVANQIERRKVDFSRLITRETGKPISFSRAEVERAILTFTLASEEAKRIEGSVLPFDLAEHSRGRFGMVRRFPIGPIGAITPFNFPINLVAHKVGPAIASGNTVVLKPSSNAPLTALLLAEVIYGSTLPKGAFNVIPCSADEAEQLVVDERIKLLSFTGSPQVGWGLKARAGKKRVVLELGGNAGVIVDDDANMEYALKRIAQGAYGNAGQSCIAVQRVYVRDKVYRAFSEKFLEQTRAIVCGDPMREATVVGPMISEEAAAKVEAWIREAVDEGARLLCGGKRSGSMFEPTILVDVKPDMKVSCQEVFAPVVTLDKFADFKEAVALVNHSPYGLQAGVFTNDIRNVFYAYESLDVGGVIINDFPTYRIDHMPYGGVKDSGFGREGVRYTIEEMTELKLLAFNFP